MSLRSQAFFWIVRKTMLFRSFSVLNQRVDTLKILMCTRSAKSDCWKKKLYQSERGLITCKRMHRGLRQNYKEQFLFQIFLIFVLFLVANDKSILHHDNIQKRKLENLLKISLNNIFSHNPERVIFTFSMYALTDDEKNVLCKGLNFSVKPGLIEYSEFLLPLELLFRDIKREDSCNEDMSLIKARLLDTALTHTKTFLVIEIHLKTNT